MTLIKREGTLRVIILSGGGEVEVTIIRTKRVDLSDESVRRKYKVRKKDVPEDPFVLVEAEPLGDGQHIIQTEKVSVPVIIKEDQVTIFIAGAVAEEADYLWDVHVRGMGQDWSIGLGKQYSPELTSVTVNPEEGRSALHIMGDAFSILLERHANPPAVFLERG